MATVALIVPPPASVPPLIVVFESIEPLMTKVPPLTLVVPV